MNGNKFLLSLVFGFIVSANSHAVLMTEVSENAYITVDGYDVAWAGPCAVSNPSCGAMDFSYQAQFGWEAMDTNLFTALGITAQDFVFDGANVDYASGNNLDEASGARVAAVGGTPPGGDVAVAAPWFSSRHLHIDWQDGYRNLWSFSDANGSSWWESLAVRQSQSVPEPAGLALLMLGLAGVVVARKRK